jgi:tetratricopeptide (TPR) repeat protein
LSEISDSQGLEKDKFFDQLNRLSKAPNANFALSDSLRSIIDNIPADKFRIIPSRLVCKRHLISELPTNVLSELSKEELKYYVIEYESDSLEKNYGQQDALKMLSTIIERNPGNGNLIRDVAFSAMRLGLSQHAYYLFKKVVEKIPNEPHAYHALAQILSDMGYNDLAMLYYEIAYTTNWDGRFGDTKNIVGLDYLRFLRSINNSKSKIFSKEFASNRLNSLETLFNNKNNRFNLDKINVMVSITWNTNNSDIDLHVMEPSKEDCFYSNQNTKNGGCLTYDVTQGYGPEMYISPASLNGIYKVSVHYYSDVINRASTRSQVYIVIYENWGKKNEKVSRKVVSLKDRQESQEISKIQIGLMD